MSGSDEALLRAVAGLYGELDPAPSDLGDGVLARLAVEGLEAEFELLTLVRTVDIAAGTRHAAEPETAGQAALEFAGSAYRILVRVSRTESGGRRLDGWVVPALPMRVFLGPSGDAVAHLRRSTYADTSGRFEFVDPPEGEVRLWLLPQGEPGTAAYAPPFVTPGFLL